MTKAIFQAPQNPNYNNFWPGFYFFMTSTQIAELPDGNKRVRDGLIFSEYNFRTSLKLNLMRTEVEAADSFVKSDSGSLTGLIYSDSKIMPQDDPSERFLKRTLLVDEKLRK